MNIFYKKNLTLHQFTEKLVHIWLKESDLGLKACLWLFRAPQEFIFFLSNLNFFFVAKVSGLASVLMIEGHLGDTNGRGRKNEKNLKNHLLFTLISKK